jgi:hypothetical protein
MAGRDLKLYGTEEPKPEQRVLRAGPVTTTFESGQLRWIKVGAAEAIRGISFVVRTRIWATPVPEISDLRIIERAEGFRVTFTAICRTEDGNFTWKGDFRGSADGTIRCIAAGSPDRDFLTGRTGFVILHPLAGFAGRPVEIEHTDGSVEKLTVPEAIDPAQPFFLVRSLTHAPMRGVKATIRMEGDSWETEDHRNWTDASFKTYCRPLSLPWPYLIKAGETVRHKVTLGFAGKLPKAAPAKERPVTVTLGRASGRMPEIGLSVLPEDAEAALGASDIVRAAGRVRADVVLEIILADGMPPASQLAEVAKAVKAEGLRVAAVIATPAADLKSYPPGTPGPQGVPTWHETARMVRKAFPRARVGGGMLSNFTELNRKRPPKGLFEFITHATSALVHAADDRSVMETLEAIGHIIRSTKRIIGRTPYRIGPSHIGNSFNPYGESYAANPAGGRVTMARVDPRHRGLFGAAWHLGYLSQVAEGGLEAATMASPVGEFGIAARRLPHPQPWFDENPDAAVYPVFHVLRGVAVGAGEKHVTAESNDPARLAALAFRTGEGTRLWLANLREINTSVRLKTLPKGETRISMLDEDSFDDAVRDTSFGDLTAPLRGSTVTLRPFAVARIDIGG